MLDAAMTDEGFDESCYSPPPIEALQTNPDSLISLTIIISPQAAYRAYDEFDESCVEKCDNGWFRVTATLPGGQLAVWLFKVAGQGCSHCQPGAPERKIQNGNIT